MRVRISGLVSTAMAIVTSLFAACGDPASPGIQPEIVNNTDHFSYQVSNIQNYSATVAYAWQNTGTQANVNQACSISGGTVTLVILDGTSTQVYSQSLADNGTFTTPAGTAGTWTVRVIFSSASGTLNFRADKTT